tara:strand:+ start:425 stop:1078 length:654 start_codon:yes stop_codon:yes gene_type:complete
MTQFRDGFMMKSPLPKHQQKFYDKARELSEKSGTPGDYNRDDPKVNEQLAKAEEAEKSHESDSAAKMSPFHGYVDGEERASHFQPTADLYQNLFNTLQANVDKISEASGPENMAKRKAMKAQRLEKRIDKRNQRADDKGVKDEERTIQTKGGTSTYKYTDPKRAKFDEKTAKLEKKQAEALVDQTQFENIANQNKQNDYNDLIANMTEADKKKYGIK